MTASFGASGSSSGWGEARDDFFDYPVGLGFEFLAGLILYGVRYVDCVEFGASEGGGLGASGCHEFVGGHGDSRDSESFKLNRVVQTARCAGPSIGESLDYGVRGSEAFKYCGWSGFGVCRLLVADYPGCGVSGFQQMLNPVEEDAPAWFGDVEERDSLATE